MLPELCKTWIWSLCFVTSLQDKLSVKFCISLCFRHCNDKVLIKIEKTFIKFCKYYYLNQLMFMRLSWFKDFSGGGATIREGALIRRNMVFLYWHRGRRRKCCLSAFSPFPTVFSKASVFRDIESKDCVLQSLRLDQTEGICRWQTRWLDLS